ncbi:MAG: CvpA family protein [Chitinophagaceae bacterium]|nr:MAG: CvpA family protein [Chitinophagaceae bacterium]
MLIDIIALVLLVMAIFKGLSKGVIVALFSFLAFIIGLAAALKLSAAMAEYIGANVEVSQRWLPFLAFIVVFVIVVLLIRLGAKLLQSAVQMVMLGWVNRIGGVLFYVLIYYFIYSILLFYATQLGLIKPATVEASVTYNYIAPFGPKMMEILGSVIPWFKNMFEELLHFFDAVGEDSKQQSGSFFLSLHLIA